jgi:hypothetical protein
VGLREVPATVLLLRQEPASLSMSLQGCGVFEYTSTTIAASIVPNTVFDGTKEVADLNAALRIVISQDSSTDENDLL